MRPPIHAADLLRAFKAIDAQTDDAKRDIAAMLGFDWQPLSPRPNRKTDAARRRPRPQAPDPTPSPTQPHRPTPPAPVTRRDTAIGIDIVEAPPVSPPQLAWVGTGQALETGTLGRPPRPAPLFRPNWSRAILTASLSARAPIGAPDLERAVERIARGEALRVLPRQPIPTLARGVQALIDVGDNMQPFRQDQAVLQRDLKRIIGAGSLDIVQCMGSPRRVRRGNRGRAWHDYEARFAPALGACVLIVSDFGIGGGMSFTRGASPYVWAMLARRLARRGHRLVGFAPYPAKRFPAELLRAIELVQWDRATTAGRIGLARAGRPIA